MRHRHPGFLFVIPTKVGIHCAAGNSPITSANKKYHCVAMDTGLRRYDDFTAHPKTPDEADAIAIAIAHANMSALERLIP